MPSLEIVEVKGIDSSILEKIIFKFKGLYCSAIVRNWNEKNMTIRHLEIYSGYAREEAKEIIDALFDLAEDTADLRDQDNEGDASIQEEEEKEVSNVEEE